MKTEYKVTIYDVITNKEKWFAIFKTQEEVFDTILDFCGRSKTFAARIEII